MTKARIYKRNGIWWVEGPALLGASSTWSAAIEMFDRHLRWLGGAA